MKLRLTNVRLAFPALFEPKTVNGEGDPAFSATFLLEQNHPCVAEIREAMENLGKEKWAAKWPAIKKELDARDKGALHDGDSKSSYAGFEGNLFVSARSKTRPLVIDRDKTPLVERDGRPYGGCYVNATIDLWAQDNAYGKRINASLRGVQFVKDGDAFGGGGVATADEFDDLVDLV